MTTKIPSSKRIVSLPTGGAGCLTTNYTANMDRGPVVNVIPARSIDMRNELRLNLGQLQRRDYNRYCFPCAKVFDGPRFCPDCGLYTGQRIPWPMSRRLWPRFLLWASIIALVVGATWYVCFEVVVK